MGKVEKKQPTAVKPKAWYQTDKHPTIIHRIVSSSLLRRMFAIGVCALIFYTVNSWISHKHRTAVAAAAAAKERHPAPTPAPPAPEPEPEPELDPVSLNPPPPFTTRFGFPVRFDHLPGNITVLSEDPLIVQIDDFLTEDEVDYMKTLAEAKGYERSGVGGVPTLTSETQARTSAHVFLTGEESNARVVAIESKIQLITSIPPSHYEHFQVVRYTGA
jgi:hypothetical protein